MAGKQTLAKSKVEETCESRCVSVLQSMMVGGEIGRNNQKRAYGRDPAWNSIGRTPADILEKNTQVGLSLIHI